MTSKKVTPANMALAMTLMIACTRCGTSMHSAHIDRAMHALCTPRDTKGAGRVMTPGSNADKDPHLAGNAGRNHWVVDSAHRIRLHF